MVKRRRRQCQFRVEYTHSGEVYRCAKDEGHKGAHGNENVSWTRIPMFAAEMARWMDPHRTENT